MLSTAKIEHRRGRLLFLFSCFRFLDYLGMVESLQIELKLQPECFFLSFTFTVNKHKPWIETSYHGVITENMDTVLLDPPLVALDKDSPLPFAGKEMQIHPDPSYCI